MIKKSLFFIAIVSASFGFTFQDEISDICDSSAAKKACKKALKPEFEYDAAKSSKFTFKTKKQFKELEIPLYVGEKYRFAFNTEYLPQGIDIEIYDKHYEHAKRQLLFSSRNFPNDQKEFVFEPDRVKRVYIDYIVPPTNDSIKKGCVVFALGYRLRK